MIVFSLLCKSQYCMVWLLIFVGIKISWISLGFLSMIVYEVLYTRCLRYNFGSTWFLDIRISTCYLWRTLLIVVMQYIFYFYYIHIFNGLANSHTKSALGCLWFSSLKEDDISNVMVGSGFAYVLQYKYNGKVPSLLSNMGRWNEWFTDDS